MNTLLRSDHSDHCVSMPRVILTRSGRASPVNMAARNAIPAHLFDPVACEVPASVLSRRRPTIRRRDVCSRNSHRRRRSNRKTTSTTACCSRHPYESYFGRLDYDITSNNRLTHVRYAERLLRSLPEHQFSPALSVARPAMWTTTTRRSPTCGTSVRRTVNEARIGYHQPVELLCGPRSEQRIRQPSWAGSLPRQTTFPAINTTGTYPYAGSPQVPTRSTRNSRLDPSDVVTMIRGKHILHFGGEFLVYQRQFHRLGQHQRRHYAVLRAVHRNNGRVDAVQRVWPVPLPERAWSTPTSCWAMSTVGTQASQPGVRSAPEEPADVSFRTISSCVRT